MKLRNWWERAEGQRVERAAWLNTRYPYRLNVWRHTASGIWSHEHVYAYKIDICTGILPKLPIEDWTEFVEANGWPEASKGISSNKAVPIP